MMKTRAVLLLLLPFVISSCLFGASNAKEQLDRPSTLAFGSCLRQWHAQPVWNGVKTLRPDAFIFMGDNIYSDIGYYKKLQEPLRIRQAYQDLNSSADFQAFIQFAEHHRMPIYGTWDDHDYGKNDAGVEYPYQTESKRYFLEFFNLQQTVTGDYSHPGIYHSQYLDLNGVKVQLLLLDTRSFRSKLQHAAPTALCPRINLTADNSPDATLLGEKQWRWLESELLKAADIRVLVSSIQLLPAEHCFEKWANFPSERSRFFKLLKKTGANGVIVLSGDRHLAEISVLPDQEIGYPLYEITSSGLNSARGAHWNGRTEQNKLRVYPDNVLIDNFGSIQVFRKNEDITLKLQIRDVAGVVLQEKQVSLQTLRI